MIRGQIRQGRVEMDDAIPEEWEGRHVQIIPLTPDDPIPDLEERLALLQSLGPVEYEPGEREQIASGLAELDRLSRDQMNHLVDHP